MARLRKRSVILARVEVTPGVDPVPTPAEHAILAYDVVVTPVGERIERDPSRGTLSPFPHLIGRRYREITFMTEIASSGTSHSTATPPRTGALFQACGMLETRTTETPAGAGNGSVVYRPASTGLRTTTIYAYIDGLLWRLHGCMGNWEIVCEAGQPGRINWTFQGTYVPPTDVAVPSPVTYDPTTPPLVLSSGFTLNAITTLIAQQLSVALGNNIVLRDDINSPSGYAASLITGRAGSGSFNPEVTSVAAYDFERDWRDALQRAMAISLGTVAGNRIGITAPRVQLDAPAHADRDGIFVFDVPFFLSMNTGDDEISINLT